MIRKNGKVYLTIKEFAEAANVSHQAVYKQLQTRLNDYKIEVKNQTYIDISTLEKFYGEETATEVEQVAQAEVELKKDNEAAQKQLQQLEEMIEFLKSEIKEKNIQIENLSDRLQAAIKSIDQEQQLHLVTQQKLLLIEKKEEAEAAQGEQSQEGAEKTAAKKSFNENEEEQTEKSQKKGFFSKFFK